MSTVNSEWVNLGPPPIYRPRGLSDDSFLTEQSIEIPETQTPSSLGGALEHLQPNRSLIMTPINPINLTNLLSSGYAQQEQRSVGERKIYRYILESTASDQIVSRGAESVRSLIRDNPDLVAMFPTSPREELESALREGPYLVINGRAVCLSKKPKAPPSLQPSHVDFFSESIPSEPVQCELAQHTFEKKYIDLWKAAVGDMCPGGVRSHSVGRTIMDPELLEQIQQAVIVVEREGADRQEQARNIGFIRAESRAASSRLDALEKKKIHEVANSTGGFVKVGVKIGGALAKKHACKAGECCALHSAAKKVPIISILAGLGLAYNRNINGESKKKVIAELASGFAGAFIGLGTAVSFVIDVGLLKLDIDELLKRTTETDGNVSVELTKEEALGGLGLDPNVDPTKEEIEAGFRNLSSRGAHPDRRLAEEGVYSAEEYAEMQRMLLSSCKEALYNYYGYN